MELVCIWEVTFWGEASLNYGRRSCSGDLVTTACDRGREGRAGGCGDSWAMDLIFFFFSFPFWQLNKKPLACSHLFWLQLLRGGRGAVFLPSANWQSGPAFALCCSVCWRQHFCLWGACSAPPAPALKSLFLGSRMWTSTSLLCEQGLGFYLIGPSSKPAILRRRLDGFAPFHALYNLQGWVLMTQLWQMLTPGFREIRSNSSTVAKLVGGRTGGLPQDFSIPEPGSSIPVLVHRQRVPSAQGEKGLQTQNASVWCAKGMWVMS